MTYVHVPPATSQNAQRLADELRRVIAEHRRQYPGLSDSDVQQALRLAATGSGADRRRRIAIAVAAWLLLAFGLLAFFLFQRG